MSADNWTRCPKCFKETLSAKQRAEQSYGKIPLAEYEALRNAPDEAPEETLREDYEQGIYDGSYSVSYSAHCKKCGFQFTYEHSEPIP